MGFALGAFALADVAVGAETAALPAEIGLGAEAAAGAFGAGAADLTAGAFAADAGITGAAATEGAGFGLGGFGAGAAGADAGAALGAAGAGAAGADALGAGGALAAGDAFAPFAAQAADFSALGAGGAAAAPGADIGSLSAVSTPTSFAPGTFGTSAATATTPAGGVVNPTDAMNIGSQDILSQASPDLLEANAQSSAVPQNALLSDGGGPPAGEFGSGAQPGVGYNTPGAPASVTGEAPPSGIDPAAFANTPQAPTGDALQPGGAQQITQPLEQSNFVTGQGASAAPPAAAAPAAAATPAAAPTGAGAAPAAGGGAFGGSGWGWKAAGLGLAAAPLALTLAKGESPLPPQAGQAQTLANSNQAAASPFINSVISNSPTLSQAAQLNQQQQNYTNQWRQVLFNQGVQRPEADSRWPQIQATIQQDMQIRTQTMIQSNLQAALGFSGQASNNLLQLANLQVQQDTAFTNAIAGSTKALGTVAALGAASGR